jgi:hypothetical protein
MKNPRDRDLRKAPGKGRGIPACRENVRTGDSVMDRSIASREKEKL